MGNSWTRRTASFLRVFSHRKSETPFEDQEKHNEPPRIRKMLTNPEEVEDFRKDQGSNPLIVFTLQELKYITGNFRRSNILGGGGFGRVYRGLLAEAFREGIQPIDVAVKVHDGEQSFQGHREWLAEVIYLGQLSHPNLVKLVGYCCEDDHRVLVYEFMTRGSVESNLFSNSVPFSWAHRMKVALGAARGLSFLHEAEQPIIYRDFKIANILLDEDYEAKLADFGLAKEGPVGDQSHVSTRIMGTQGYVAPEYLRTGHLTASSDVYSFGVVLLELLSGRRCFDKLRPSEQQNLADWALPLLAQRKKSLTIIDPRLEGEFPVKGAQKAALLAFHCLNRNPKARPLMRDVVDTLEPLQICSS